MTVHGIGYFETKPNVIFFKFLGFNTIISKLEVGNILVNLKNAKGMSNLYENKKVSRGWCNNGFKLTKNATLKCL